MEQDYQHMVMTFMWSQTFHTISQHPIIFKLLETKEIKTASLMIQKEVCDRLVSKPGSKTYNNLSVILQYHTIVYKMLDVKRHMFHPKPNVDSAVVRIEKREQPFLDETKEKNFC